MNYPIPANLQEMVDLWQKPVNEELVAAAIAGTIRIARSQGKSLADITAEVLAEDNLLDQAQRRWLSNVVAQAWESFP
jgi:FixJ family two-component response regulator